MLLSSYKYDEILLNIPESYLDNILIINKIYCILLLISLSFIPIDNLYPVNFSTRQLFYILLTVLSTSIYGNDNIEIPENFDDWTEIVTSIGILNQDSAITLYSRSTHHYLKANDTLSAIKSLVQIATIHGHQADYQSAYDNLWQALILADKADNLEGKILANLFLGRYYSFYKRTNQSIQYLQEAVKLTRSGIEKGVLAKEQLVNCFYQLCATYREFNDPNNAQLYLDSCYLFASQEILDNNQYLKFEKANILMAQGQASKALEILQGIQPWFEKNNPAYQVLLFTYMGDGHIELNDSQRAEALYLSAIDFSK